MRYLLSLLIVFLAASGADALSLQYTDKKLSITCENTPLSQIAQALSDTLHLNVYLDKAQQSKKISINIQNIPFERAIRMLAYPLNYAIVKDYSGTIQELRIFKNPSIKDNEYARYGNVTAASESAQQSSQSPEVAITQSLSSEPVQVFDSIPSYSTSTFTPTSGVKGNDGLAVASWVTARMMQKDLLMQNSIAESKQQQAIKTSAQSTMILAQVSAINNNTFKFNSTTPVPEQNNSSSQQTTDTQATVAVSASTISSMMSDPRLQQYAQMMMATTRGAASSSSGNSAYLAYMQMLSQRAAQQAMLSNQSAQQATNSPMLYLIGQTNKVK